MNPLKQMRKARNLTEQDVALHLGLPGRCIRMFEDGHPMLNADAIKKITQLYKVSVTELSKAFNQVKI